MIIQTIRLDPSEPNAPATHPLEQGRSVWSRPDRRWPVDGSRDRVPRTRLLGTTRMLTLRSLLRKGQRGTCAAFAGGLVMRRHRRGLVLRGWRAEIFVHSALPGRWSRLIEPDLDRTVSCDVLEDVAESSSTVRPADVWLATVAGDSSSRATADRGRRPRARYRPRRSTARWALLGGCLHPPRAGASLRRRPLAVSGSLLGDGDWWRALRLLAVRRS
jgi:hypothetical protein